MKIVSTVFERWFPTKAPELTLGDVMGASPVPDYNQMLAKHLEECRIREKVNSLKKLIPDIQPLPLPKPNTQNYMVLVALSNGEELTANAIRKLCRSTSPNARLSDARLFLKSHGIYLEPVPAPHEGKASKAHRLSVWDRQQLKGMLV